MRFRGRAGWRAGGETCTNTVAGQEGRRSLAFLRQPRGRYPHGPKANKERGDSKNSRGVWITTAPRCSQDAEGFPAGPRGRGRLREHAWRRWGEKHVCRACVCTSICDTLEAAGPHSSSGMWDFQVENSTHGGRGEGEGQRRRAERSGSGLIIIIIIPHSAHRRGNQED